MATMMAADAERHIQRRQELGKLLASAPSFAAFSRNAWPTDCAVKDGLAAVHEAGHAVACQVLGGRIHEAVLAPKGFGANAFGATYYKNGGKPEHISPAVTFGGIYAEARWMQGQRPDRDALAAARRRNQSDCGKLDVLTASGDVSYQDANSTIERCWPAVMRVAAKIFSTGSANEADVLTALGCDQNDRIGTAHRLASLRAGLISM